ncbi:MAG: fumarylacetoacetate hydrolase family protein [Lachnospiraceae bacterium]|nr:fumarylacetoacetate hydrolase family protein [Lachnospiraceae bacterium]
MKLLTFMNMTDDAPQVGILHKTKNAIIPFSILDIEYKDMLEVIGQLTHAEFERLNLAQEAPDIPTVPLSSVKLCAPISKPPQDIICLGINYREHQKEATQYEPSTYTTRKAYATYFSKRVNETTACGEIIPSYSHLVDSLDYEAELAVIIGKDAKNVSEEEAEKYIFGYTILNDISARNIQKRHTQWYFGKSFDGFTPLGPYITTADEMPFPLNASIRSYVNGELRQDSNTNLMLFTIPQIISELSQGMTLKAGTIISTGTPAGVGMGFQPPKFLQPGDEVRCEIEGIGTLINTIGN